MELDNQLAQGQSDSAASRFGAIAEVKEVRPALARNTRPGIGKVQSQLSAFSTGGNADRPAVRLSFHRVAQKVIEGLAQARLVAFDLPWTRDQLLGQRDLLSRALRRHRVQTRLEHLR